MLQAGDMLAVLVENKSEFEGLRQAEVTAGRGESSETSHSARCVGTRRKDGAPALLFACERIDADVQRVGGGAEGGGEPAQDARIPADAYEAFLKER